MVRPLALALVLGALVLALAGCGGQTGPGNNPDFRFSTAPSPRPPPGSDCIGRTGATVAKELINIRTFEIVLGGGANPMPDEEWAGFRPRLPWIKNSTRFLLFDDSCFFRSPGVSADCMGDACVRFVEEFDHTWLLLILLAIGLGTQILASSASLWLGSGACLRWGSPTKTLLRVRDDLQSKKAPGR